jgi:hypothetical protein
MESIVRPTSIFHLSLESCLRFHWLFYSGLKNRIVSLHSDERGKLLLSTASPIYYTAASAAAAAAAFPHSSEAMFFRFVCPMHLQINITMPASDTLSDILMVSRGAPARPPACINVCMFIVCEKYQARAAAILRADNNNNNSSNQQNCNNASYLLTLKLYVRELCI